MFARALTTSFSIYQKNVSRLYQSHSAGLFTHYCCAMSTKYESGSTTMAVTWHDEAREASEARDSRTVGRSLGSDGRSGAVARDPCIAGDVELEEEPRGRAGTDARAEMDVREGCAARSPFPVEARNRESRDRHGEAPVRDEATLDVLDEAVDASPLGSVESWRRAALACEESCRALERRIVRRPSRCAPPPGPSKLSPLSCAMKRS